MAIGKRLLNKRLHREPAVKETCGKATVQLLLPLIYENVSDRELDLQIKSEESQRERDELKKQWLHWRSFPVDEAWKDNCCIIRGAFSGREFLVVNNKKLAELKTTRNIYKHVRECLQLQKHISLRLTYCDCRLWKTRWNEHIVACNDSDCMRYLTGAILQAVVHP